MKAAEYGGFETMKLKNTKTLKVILSTKNHFIYNIIGPIHLEFWQKFIFDLFNQSSRIIYSIFTLVVLKATIVIQYEGKN